MLRHIWNRFARSDKDGQNRKLQKNKSVVSGEFSQINSPVFIGKL